MQGAGNDYIYIDSSLYKIKDPTTAAITLSDRHKGIGSDGLVLIGRSPSPEADFTMRIFNADGSEAMMCGNASRCIGKYVYEKKLTQETDIRLSTLSGIKKLQLQVKGHQVKAVTVDMLEPQLENEAQFHTSSKLPEGTFVSMGNPHYVIFTDEINRIADDGPVLEEQVAGSPWPVEQELALRPWLQSLRGEPSAIRISSWMAVSFTSIGMRPTITSI